MNEPYRVFITSDVKIYTTETQVWLEMGEVKMVLAESPVRLKLGCDVELLLPTDEDEGSWDEYQHVKARTQEAR